MRKILPGVLLSGALLLGACGGPATVNDAANQAGTVVADPTTSAALAEPTTAAAIGDAVNQAATALTGPAAATTVTDAVNSLSAVADDVTIQQGEALILDASQSAGNIADYKWTIEKAPTGAEAVIGQTIREGSSGNVSLEPTDYQKYFPQAGPYTIRLTVTDTSGKTATDDFEIMVP